MNQHKLHAWVVDRTRPTRSLFHRVHWTTRMLTVVRTQRLGKRLSSHTVQYLETQHRLASLGRIVSCLRPLQRRVLAYLWRPGGPLMIRHVLRPSRAMWESFL